MDDFEMPEMYEDDAEEFERNELVHDRDEEAREFDDELAADFAALETARTCAPICDVQRAFALAMRGATDTGLARLLGIVLDAERKPWTDADARRLAAAVEIGRRMIERTTPEKLSARDSEAAASILRPRLHGLRHEEFWAIVLNSRLDVLKVVRIASGGISSCSVLPRECFAPAIIEAGAAVIFGHNHPSGNPTPSADDKRLFARLDEAGRALGIEVLDHLVLGDGQFCSERAGFSMYRAIA